MMGDRGSQQSKAVGIVVEMADVTGKAMQFPRSAVEIYISTDESG